MARTKRTERIKPKLWPIKDVPDSTQAKIKGYKALRGLKTLAEALDEMADIALASLQKK
jgi:hypothetical protein